VEEGALFKVNVKGKDNGKGKCVGKRQR